MTIVHIDSDELYPYYFESKPGPWAKPMSASDAEVEFIRETEARFVFIQSLMESRIEPGEGFIAEERAEVLALSRQKLIDLGITPPVADDQQGVAS